MTDEPQHKTVFGGSTSLPNALLDALLPTLSDTELRVLLVVARSTLGWKEGSGRKGRDWLSHAQLQRRTGRSGAPVSKAIDTLVKRGLIVVQDEAGRDRASASERRALRSSLFFRLGNDLVGGALPYPSGASATGHPVTSLESKDGEDAEPALSSVSTSLSKDTAAPPASFTAEEGGREAARPVSIGESEAVADPENISTLERRLHFLKTTKETKTKDSKKEVPLSSLLSTAPSEETKDEDVKMWEQETIRVLDRFEHAYQAARPDDVAAPPEEADVALLRNYFDRGYEEKLDKWLPAFFACSYGFVRRRHYSFHSYLHCFFILQVHAGAIGIKTM